MKLNAKTVTTIREPGRYADGAGLYLQVTPTGVRSWVLRYERGGRERMLGLGPLRDIGLAQARERARRARVQLLDGIDPVDAKRATKAVPTMTFKQAATTYYKDHEKKWAAKHQFLKSLERYAFPKIGDMNVATIDTDDVLRVVQPLWNTKTETASKVRRRIETVLAWTIVSGFRKSDNPAIWKGRLSVLLPSPGKVAPVKHLPALPWTETAAFVAALRKREGVAARALEFTILCATRTNETLGAKWSEIDFQNASWTIPAARTKTRSELRVPLSEPAIALLRALPVEDNNDFIFIGRFGGSRLGETSMAEICRAMRPGITVHGFRSTFKDWTSEVTTHPNFVSEQALGHAIASSVEAAYRRGDLFEKRRALMRDWANYLDGVVIDNVVQLRSAQ